MQPSQPKSSAAETPDWDNLLKVLQQSIEPKPVTYASINFAAGSFPEQMAFVEDDSDLQYAFCTRRAAKSYSGGLKAYRKALQIPRCSVLIAGLHRDEVKRIWWEPIMKPIAERLGIGIKANETELSIRLGNRSTIYLLGMDADDRQKRKALGQKFPLVLIDEAQDWLTDLNALVFAILKPAVADYNGTIGLMGTPGLVAKGLFYDVTTGKEPGWTRHEWDTYQNTSVDPHDGKRMCDKWDSEIKKLIATKGRAIEDTPWFQRNYRKKWVVDEDAKVYRYLAGRNDHDGLPTHSRGEWAFVLGVDLGHTDQTSFEVAAYHTHDPVLYFVESHAESGLDLTDVANRAKALDRKFHFSAWVVDGSNKQAVEEMRRRHDIPWQPANKTGKAEFIDLMNAEFIAGCIKLNPETCRSMVSDYGGLIWDQKKLKATGTREEHPGCSNHSADGGLYAWRYCYQYMAEPLPREPIQRNSAEWHAAEQARLQMQADAEYERELELASQRTQNKRDDSRDEEMLF